MREEPRPFQVYKHFKGAYYQVLHIAKHSETGEKLVIYRRLFEGDDVCARPLDMFLSDVDHEKYPDVKQKYRFALVTGPGKQSKPGEVQNEPEESKEESKEENMEESEEDGKEESKYDILDAFLDAGTSEEKLDILTGSWKTITEENIDNIAVVLDMELTGNTLEDKYKEILGCLKMRARYESSRLRQG